eukprot:g11821.t1
MSKDANPSKEKVNTPKMSKEKQKEYQEYLIAVAEKLAADETERLTKLGEFLEIKDEFAAFHDSFFEKLEAQLAKDVAKATDVSLGEHGVPEEVAMKVNEFQGARFQLPHMLPAKVMAIPHIVFSELWREEGERLIAAAIRRIAREVHRSAALFFFTKSNQQVASTCDIDTISAWLSRGSRHFTTVEMTDVVNKLLSAFEGAGYTKESHDVNGFGNLSAISLTW